MTRSIPLSSPPAKLRPSLTLACLAVADEARELGRQGETILEVLDGPGELWITTDSDHEHGVCICAVTDEARP
jgi:hypothetical protein